MGRGREERRVQGPRHPIVRARQARPLSDLLAVVFDLDGTLLDSDEALAAAYVALGVPREEVTFGHVVAEECRRLGLTVDDYLDRYDVERAQPFPGVDDLVRALPVRWAVCSNKVGRHGRAELARLGWRPDVALFAEDFGGPKRLGPVLDALAVDAGRALFVGDTAHDRACAHEVGAAFVLAGWNRRARREASPGDVVLERPLALLDLL